MTIKELKESIINGKISLPMVWKIEDDSSLITAYQYYHKIGEILKLEIKSIESLDEIPAPSFIEDNNLYILRTKEFNGELTGNVIVVCNSTKSPCIKIPSLEQWQVEDFIANKVIGISGDDIKWLSSQYGNNYFRFISDMDKISIFEPGSQNDIFKELLDEDGFKGITSLNIWDLSNAILRKEKDIIVKVLEVIDYIDVEPIGLLTVLYNNFKRVINIQTNASANAKDLGISDKQFYAIKKNNCGYYSNERLIKIFKMLTDMEYEFKFGGISQSQLIDYMICKILEE